jgi:hypothetical protein
MIDGFPNHAHSLRSWLLEHVEPLVGVIAQMAVQERPEMSPAPSSEDVLPDESLVPFILDAIANTAVAAAAKWRSAPVRVLAFFFMCEWVFRGRVHLRLHVALEEALSAFLLAVTAAGSSTERWPNYIDYFSGRAKFVPRSWRPSPQSHLGPTSVAAGAASVVSITSATSKQPPSKPWAVLNPDAPRTADCPHCGPGTTHSLGSCTSYSAYVHAGHKPRLPLNRYFPVGRTFKQAWAEAKANRSVPQSAVTAALVGQPN